MLNLTRTLLSLAFVSLLLSSQGAVIEWKANTTGFWSEKDNWVGGVVPTDLDSAVIDGGNQFVKINEAVSALYVYVGLADSMEIYPDGHLVIEDSPETGLYSRGDLIIQGKLTVNNAGFRAVWSQGNMWINGLITVDDCDTGLFQIGMGKTLTNEGTIQINEMVNNGIQVSSYGSLVNSGTINMTGCNIGLFLLTRGTAYCTTSSDITINQTTSRAISVRHNCTLANEGDIEIDEYGIIGIESFGAVDNFGSLIISQDVSGGVGISIDSFSCCSEIYLGSLTNELGGIIQIGHAETGLRCEPSTVCINRGEVDIMNCSGTGFYMEPRSIAQIISGATFTISDVSDPMIIDHEATLDVRQGAELIAEP